MSDNHAWRTGRSWGKHLWSLSYCSVTSGDAPLENEKTYHASHDLLTGLPNRPELLKRLQNIINTSEKNKQKFAVLFLDFDRFKLVNDSLSHKVGDIILQSAARRLQNVISKDDTLARLNGDEFVIVFGGQHRNNSYNRGWQNIRTGTEAVKSHSSGLDLCSF